MAPVFLLLLLLLPAATARADVYGYADDEGVHLSNVPGDARYTVYVAEPAAPAPSPARSEPAPRAAGSRAEYDALIRQVADRHRLSPALLHAVVTTESNYDPLAVSPKGALGLMQLMPATAARYGVTDARDPLQNLSGGARYLSDLLKRFNQDLPLALAAYNAGEEAVQRFGNAIPPFRETRRYVDRVIQLHGQLRKQD